MGTNSGQVNFVHHLDTSTISNGAELSVKAHMLTSMIEISGNATGFTVVFEGRALDNGSFYPIAAINLSDLNVSSTATANGLYQVSVDGLIKFRTRVSVIGSGAITVKNRAVN